MLKDYVEALRVLASVSKYLASQYRDSLPPAEARAHFGARSLITKAEVLTYNEACRAAWKRGVDAEAIEILPGESPVGAAVREGKRLAVNRG